MSISKAEHDELCCVYAGLLLFDDKIEITGEKLSKVIAASGNTVESYYPDFFAKFLKSVDIDKLLQAVGSGAASGSGDAPVATSSAPAEKKDDKKPDAKGADKKGAPAKKEEKKKEPEPEEEDMPMGLF